MVRFAYIIETLLLFQVQDESEEYQKLLTLYKQQRCQIEEMQETIETDKKQIELLLETGDFSGKWKKKFKYEQKRRIELHKRQGMVFNSNWLSESQVTRLQRKSSRGMKWDIDAIREGLILRVKCGSSGYHEFVSRCPLYPSLRSLQQAVQCIRFDSGMLEDVFNMLDVLGRTMPDMQRDC